MIEIQLEEGDRIDWALKSFKRMVQRAGVLAEVRRRRHYVKPSEARQLKSEAAQRRARAARNKNRG
ncbi:30S ribosomal protein S21 [Gemmatirosa kalamazoonensis]|jgi:small subunit ribosomal protein S21|uniref:Small ribosomal subunit protein bS21 n=1 Tax=Gemmatirosa kalamazoonensis TaxID=861299 RepID=W0RGX6_9BACT|nr:30S ribosomal protein S21 [Gemmatirosa kalamazoonensis]AHG89585.1 30S ribosomal protein S21 [Gemmatirosa kalamazoonensis]